MKFKSYLAFPIVLLFISCGAFNQPTSIETAVMEKVLQHVHFKRASQSKEPIVVGIYKFRDQTGQYKASEMGAHLVP
jgi:curli production assembly/transport component CsgG